MELKYTLSFGDSRLSKLFKLILCILFLLPASMIAQGGTCAEIEPFCAGNEALIFPNCNNTEPSCVASAEPGPDYSCLGTQPYPAWFFLQIDNPGDLSFQIVQNSAFDVNGNPVGTPLDVDFIAWGPFAEGDDLCDYSQLQSANEVDCSFSAAAVENFTITNATQGDLYVLVITNYSQNPGFIKLEQVAGGGSTDCGIVCDIVIDGGDQVFCDTPEYTLTTTPTGSVDSYEWFFNGALIPGENGETLTVSQTGDYRVVADSATCNSPVEDEVTITFLTSPNCTVAPVCSGIDFEENFGTGTGRVCDLNGATTTYNCNQTTQVNDGEYSISNISDGLNTGWHVGMEDHTEGDVNGRMLFVNADFAPGEFYRRTITLNENIDYTFSAWITTVYDTDTGICTGTGIPANVIFRIEDPGGNLIQETNTGDIQNEADPNWQQFFINFNTGANTNIQLVLINNAPGGCGNDLAIDDITLSLDSSEPVIVDPQDLSACDVDNNGVEVFDLLSQIPEILDGQDPAEFNVSFHLTQFEAEANQNPIATPDAYQNVSNPETIYVRVEKVSEPSCFSTVDFELILDEVIDLQTDLPEESTICSTDPFEALDATPTNGGIDLSLVTYEWMNEAGDVVSTDAVYTPTAAGTYTVMVSYPPCSENTFTVEVVVVDTPTLDLGPDQDFCDGDSFEIVPILGGNTDGITYLWSTGETTPTIIVDTSGTYDLEITVGPCVVTDSVMLGFGELPVVDLGEDFKLCRNEPRTITATTTPSEVTYEWYLNGELISGETGNSIEITLDENAMGTQVVTAIASDGPCMGEGSVNIDLYDIANCTISEGISPNGSPGFNDELDLEFLADRAGGITRLQIFNRYGILVYQRANYVNEWAGQSDDGNELPTGNYFYVIDLASEDPVYGMQATGSVYINRGQ